MRAVCDATSSSSVLLPTPGSPASRMAAPGTRPPPSTRSSSGTPLVRAIDSLDRDLADRDGGGRHRPGGGPQRRGADLGDRPPGLALAAATDPLDRLPAALGAPVGRSDPRLLRHGGHGRRRHRHAPTPGARPSSDQLVCTTSPQLRPPACGTRPSTCARRAEIWGREPPFLGMTDTAGQALARAARDPVELLLRSPARGGGMARKRGSVRSDRFGGSTAAMGDGVAGISGDETSTGGRHTIRSR